MRSTERVRVFGWRMLHNRLLTNARKARWGLGSANCPRCTGLEESVIHVLRDCTAAVGVWHHLLRQECWYEFFTCDFEQWQELNLNLELGHHSEMRWGAVWITTCSLLWKWRNQGVYDPLFVTPMRPWDTVLRLLRNHDEANKVSATITGQFKVWRDIRWHPPDGGWMCLNSDGAVCGVSGKASCGGLIRTADGHWVRGFARYLGYTTTFLAELWGVYEGLMLAKRLGITALVVQLDSVGVVQCVQNGKVV